jgi:hypothetical protein
MTGEEGRNPGGPSAATSDGHPLRPVLTEARRMTRQPTARDTYRRLGTLGLGPAEAGNLTAYLRGLRPASQGWSTEEIDRVLFLRYLVERGRIAS